MKRDKQRVEKALQEEEEKKREKEKQKQRQI
jgi:hypothetical protein